MFHLSRFQQHHITLTAACEYTCLGCQHQLGKHLSALPKDTKPGDIINIYGGGVHRSDELQLILNQCQDNQLRARVFGNHHLLSLDHLLLKSIDQVMIWCPSPEPEDFNFMVSEPLFPEFKEALSSQSLSNLTLVFMVRPLNLSGLPEFYDLCVDIGAKGLILYGSVEFNREEKRYIKRFKRVKNMHVLNQKKHQTNHCLAVPAEINSIGFEFFEWRLAMRQTLQQIPILGQLI